MSHRSSNGSPTEEPPRAQSPEIHHPRPTRLPAKVTIATQGHATWRHYAPATAPLDNEKLEQSEGPATATTSIQRSPSAPPALNQPPAPPATTIHPLLTATPAIRTGSGPRMRFTWDVAYSPDAPPAPPAPTRRNSTVSSSTAAHHSRHTRPRSNTQPADRLPAPGLELAADLHTRLNLNYNSHPAPPAEAQQPFAAHPVALEPATTPARPRMLIVCRDLLPWLIPVYARDLNVGCTVLDVVRGIYAALHTKVEVAAQMRSTSGPGHTRSASDGVRVERRRIDWLHDKTVFVCLGRDEALVKRRLPGRAHLWEETFVLTLARRRA